MDPLGPVFLFFIERLSSLQRSKCTGIIEKGPQSVSFIESFFPISSFIWSVLYQNRIKIIFLQHFMHLAHMLGAARCSCASHLLAHQLMFMAISVLITSHKLCLLAKVN